MKRAKHNRSYWRSLYDNQKNRSYSTVPAPADRDNTLWSVRIVFINDNIKTFGEEGELRLNIIFRVSLIRSPYCRTEIMKVLNSLLTVILNRLKRQKQEDL